MKILKNIITGFLISILFGLLGYYEFFTIHSPTGRPLLVKNKHDLAVFVVILWGLIFFILNGNILLYKKKNEEEFKLKNFRKDKK